MKHVIITLLIFWSGLTCIGQDLDSLREELAKLHQQSDFPGWSIVALDTQQVLFEHSEGYADVELQKPFTPETVINIASVSKTFVAHAILTAIGQGHFTLDTPINELLPFKIDHPDHPNDPITMNHLVTHTSGIKDRNTIYYFKSYIREGEDDISLDEFMRRYFSPTGKWYSAGNFNKHIPGTHYEYSNIASALTAWIIELKVGMPFYEYSGMHTLSPIGMSNSGWRWADIDKDRHAANYKKVGKRADPYHLATYPDGGLRSSLRDLSLYLQEMMKIYYRESVLFPSIDPGLLFPLSEDRSFPGMSANQASIGTFWGKRSNGLIGHTGGDPGVSSFLFFNPETGIGKIFLTNLDIKNDKQSEQFRNIWRAVGEVYK